MQEYRPIAEWLKRTRERQTDEKGDPWTQDRLLDLMRAEIGWAPHRPNYSRYESGKSTPNRDTLAKFVTFWAGHGVDGPDLTPPPVVAEPDPAAALIAAIGELVQEMRASRAQQVESTDAVLRALAAVLPATQARPGTPDGSGNATPAGTGQ